MTESRSRTGTATALLAAQLAVAVASLLVNVLAARAMGPADRGRVALGLQVAYLGTAMALAGVDRAYLATALPGVRAGAALRDLRRLAVPGAALAAVVCTAGLVLHPAAAGWLVAAYGVCVGNAAMLLVRTAAAAAADGRVYLRAAAAGQAGLITAAAGLTATHQHTPAAWLAAYAAALCLPAAAVAARCRGNAAGADLGATRRLGLLLLPATVATTLLLRADRLLLPALASYQQLGLYVVVATMTELAAWPAQAYVDAHVPAWRVSAAAGTLPRRRILAGSMVYALAAAAVLAAAGWLCVRPLFGPAYADATRLAAPLAAAAGMYAVSRVGVGLALAADRPGTALAADLAGAAVAVTGYLTLIPHLGAMGAAVGSLLGYTTAAGLAAAGSTGGVT
jgi:O-antigen/teichoic acid export membrane protein